jgi:hypothetical protein
MGYGVNFPRMFRQAALLVDKVLKGVRLADLSIEQAVRFDLVVSKGARFHVPARLPRARRQQLDLLMPRTRLKAQQHPTQYAPCRAPIRSAPARPDRQLEAMKANGDWQFRRQNSLRGES